MTGLPATLVKSLVFVVVTVLATALLALTIANGSGGGGHTFHAEFTDVTSLNVGDDVRMAGVRVGQVTAVSVDQRTQARVSFSLQSGIRLAPTTTATIRYRNLIGQRYIALDEGTGSLTDPLPDGATIGLDHTAPALDLTVLFNGFQPLFQALSPDQINELSAEIIQVFQGDGPTIDDLVGQTASLTNTLAAKDQVIGEVIDNLNSILTVVNRNGTQLTTLVSTLASFVSGLAQDRAALGSALTGIGNLTTDVGDLLQQGRAPLKSTITSLGALSANLAGSADTLNSFLQVLPTKLTEIGRTASYGSWLNFYLCSFTGRIPLPSGSTTYLGGAPGVQPVEQRCQA